MSAQRITFRVPTVMHYERRCRICGTAWIVDCVAGATEPARDPHYRCPDHRPAVPQGLPDRWPTLVNRELVLELDLEAPSEATATITGTKNNRADLSAGSSHNPWRDDSGEPSEAGGQPQAWR